jgi:hypothetical protein
MEAFMNKAIKLKHLILFCFILGILTSALSASTISGQITAKESGEILIGANVYIKGTTIGTASDENGMYQISVEDGVYTLICDYVGYAQAVNVVDVKGDTKVDFPLTEYLFSKTIDVIADRARERETPVAFTNVNKERMVAELGSQDIPMVLNTTPSVYATMGGGGAGDARINVRGFNQRNVAIMINGVPVNDMENGWVYWSNWDGVGDATQSIQMQRGLSAVNLATPSIGGTMNIITDPTAQRAGASFKQEYGDGTFLKSTLVANSGLINDKYAVSALVVRKTGDGVIDKTWTDAWAYYLGAAYNINNANRVELYAVGAPQRHGQNLYKQNIAAFDSAYAKDLKDYDKAAIAKFKQSKSGRLYNENWGPVSASYKGKQSWNGSTYDRYSSSFISERENYYHKPQVNLNWYSNFTSDLALSTVLYYSGGQGGGSGTGYASSSSQIKYDRTGPSQVVDFNNTIASNVALGYSGGILRNSVNNQYTFGAVSKLNYKVNDKLKTTVGLDWRTAEIEHYYEVRDLLGGAYFRPTRSDYVSEFWTTAEDSILGLGDKWNYYNTNNVDWIGGFAQTEYTEKDFTVYGMFGYSGIKYGYTDHFKTNDTLANGNPDVNSGEFELESDIIYGFQVKGGAMYRLTPSLELFGNIGYVQKVPIFDNVIDDNNGVYAKDPVNEKFTSFEAGVNWRGLQNALSLKGSFYYTLWQDRAISKGIETTEGYDVIFLTGLDQLHTGFEFEAAYQPMSLFRFDMAGSFANWKHVSDAKGEYREAGSTKSYLVGVDGLKIGDAPQTQVSLAGTVFPVQGLRAQLVYRYNGTFYADWDATSRLVNDPTKADRTQSWKVPNYSLIDFHAAYNLPIQLKGVKFQLSAHVFNILDELYISDAVDNSQYNSWDKDHDADDAEVYMGIPRTFNIGLSISY